MPKCPNCSYKLVLLSSRPKYKCALCSKLFPKKEIEDKEFKIWNKKQRELDKEKLKQKKPKISKEEKLKINREYQTKKRLENISKYNKEKREYYKNNIAHLNEKRRENYARKSRVILNSQKTWKLKNKDDFKLKRRLSELRLRQKQLTQLFVKNKQYKLYTNEFEDFLPTLLLSDLLI